MTLYWGKVRTGFCRNYGYCTPCPEAIEINRVFRLLHLYKDFDLKRNARAGYKRLKVKASKCKACGKCLPKWPNDIPSIQQLEEVARTLG